MSPEQRYRTRVASLGCILCARLGMGDTPASLHHVAVGSGKRSPYALVPLCPEHHQGASGLHGMGPKAFIRQYRPPGDSEFGLLVWVNEALAQRYF
jgi:hypothetical protein